MTSEHYEDLTRPEHPLSVLAELAQLDLIKNMSVHEKGLEPHGFQRDSKEFKINEEWLESNAWNSFVKIWILKSHESQQIPLDLIRFDT